MRKLLGMMGGISASIAVCGLLPSVGRSAEEAGPGNGGAGWRAMVEAEWLERSGEMSVAASLAVLEQGRRLAERLRPGLEPSVWQGLVDQLDAVGVRAGRVKEAGAAGEALRRVHLEARWAVRAVALSNPRLRAIDRLLFITRHDAKGVFHMVDQFYGFNARPGGRLLVLVDPCGVEPQVQDLLAESIVDRGRLKGRRLTGGAFLSPEVSFDGGRVLFAWTEARGGDLEWSPAASYHLFGCNADGSGLEQLTDGPANDFDPCFLPGGRVVFVSERRGGYLRCGRHCPTYTLFGMAADGSDIVCLSYHETHEWHPSITADGMIVYTRWDYVDRDTNIAHHPWTSRPDGGDPRPLHGNYPERRESRPWMEMDIRAVPGSHKLVAVAAAHHGHAFGSLVIIDAHVADDGAMGPLTRLTPEVPFPEAEARGKGIAGAMVYGTPWPLSEEDYLCVYGTGGRPRGIYWIDRAGNRELLYRDPAISCLSPMPLGAREEPPVIPDNTLETAAARGRAADPDRAATVAVMNVYDSDFVWPAGTEVKALRVIQLLPKSTPPPNEPRIGVADQTNARAVLGTVPVEPDGSAYFEVPAGKAIYFQALDERGLAVQSMRSATYVHRGERLTCQGCHEPRHRASQPSGRTPLALRREPSKLVVEVDGANPFSYVRLVQPVLDRQCVGCHQEKQALDLCGVIEGPHGWTRSYANLAGRYGFYFHVNNGSINSGVHGGSRTIAGAFGARAARLTQYLDARHYGVELSAEDYRRVTLWLDCNSEFYGSYENTAAQGRGEIVRATLE